jgi:tetratricopeptide (TPR) repeat protein
MSQAIAMFQRLHKVDQKKAQRAVSLLANGQREQAAALAKDRTEYPSHAGTIAAQHQARTAGRGDGSDTGCKERRGETESSPVDSGVGLGNHQRLLAQTPKLGTISFPTSGSSKAQAAFTRGVLYLHNFEYDDAAKSFQEAERIEPGFAMAYWGEAMTYNHPVWQQQDRDKALAALAKLGSTPDARRAKAKTEREGRWLGAVEALYGEGNKYQRDTLYSRAMARPGSGIPEGCRGAGFLRSVSPRHELPGTGCVALHAGRGHLRRDLS